MSDIVRVPRDVLQKAHDALEEIPDCFDFGSETYILHQQIAVLLRPDTALPGYTQYTDYRP